MSFRPRSHTTLPEPFLLLKVLAELAGVLVLLLGVKTAKFLRWVVWPESHVAPARATSTTHNKVRSMPPLQWRSPWWAWQLLAWVIATLTAPTFLIVSSLLLVAAKSDHPLFWWSLPAIVAIGNAVAVLWINQQHHREFFTDRQALARRHVVIGTITGASLFLFVGMLSGFLPDMLPALVDHGAALPVLSMALYGAGLAALFAILSFPFAGAVHAALGFEDGAWQQQQQRQSDRRQLRRCLQRGQHPSPSHGDVEP